MEKRILFVDDDPKILDGLQRTLREMRSEWEMEFAVSGPEGLEHLREKPFDVVVSDMRMPGMDGVQFLMEVMRSFPQVVRIILSGHSDQQTILKSVRTAHQYLAKPCRVETLKAVLSQAFDLRNLLSDEVLKRLVSNMGTVPSLPAFYSEMMAEMESPDASVQRLGQIISKDIGMTAKVLQLVNSAFFGLPRHVSDPSQAVSLLGMETIRALVLSVDVFSRFTGESPFSFEALWDHSFRTGIFARTIAREERHEMEAGDTFIGGLLHDMGKLILGVNFPRQYGKIGSAGEKKQISPSALEKETFGASHAEVGAYLAGLWGLPNAIVEALAFHHQPAKCPDGEFSPLLAVQVANVLEHKGERLAESDFLCEPESVQAAGLPPCPHLGAWKDACLAAARRGIAQT